MSCQEESLSRVHAALRMSASRVESSTALALLLGVPVLVGLALLRRIVLALLRRVRPLLRVSLGLPIACSHSQAVLVLACRTTSMF